MSLTVSMSIPRAGSIGGGAPLLSVKVGGLVPPISPPLCTLCNYVTSNQCFLFHNSLCIFILYIFVYIFIIPYVDLLTLYTFTTCI